MIIYLWTGPDTDTYFTLLLWSIPHSSLVTEEIRKWWTYRMGLVVDQLMIDSLQHAIATQTQYAPVIAVRHSPIPQIQFPASNILQAFPFPWPESEAVHVGPSSNDPLTLFLSPRSDRGSKLRWVLCSQRTSRSWQYGGSRETWPFGAVMDDGWWLMDDRRLQCTLRYRSHVRNRDQLKWWNK